MAISFSPRVRRNLAQQMSFSHRIISTTNRYSGLCLLLISDQVPVPTNNSELFPYLNACLNNSGFDGNTPNTNKNNVLAYRLVGAAQAATLTQAGTLFSLTTNWDMVVTTSGTIGSAIMISPTWNCTDGLSLVNGTGGAASTWSGTTFPLDIGNTTGAGSIMIPNTITEANYNTFTPEYYSSFNFITDSIATSGTPFIKVSSMTTTVGQALTLNSIKIRINNFNT